MKDDHRSLGKYFHLVIIGHENICFDVTTMHYSTDTMKSNIVSDSFSSDKPASAALSVYPVGQIVEEHSSSGPIAAGSRNPVSCEMPEAKSDILIFPTFKTETLLTALNH